jgi:2,3-bisphosphoglycerate-dependent phosphoglycerate mutase
MTRLYLLRHGRTAFTEDPPRVTGQLDPPLSAAGELDARAAATRLADALRGRSRVYGSDQQRARDTAQVIADALGANPVTLLPGLRERDMGSSAGQAWADLPADAGADWEPPRALSLRVLAALRQVAAEAADEAVVVTHAGVIGVLLQALGEPPRSVAPGELLVLDAAPSGALSLAPGPDQDPREEES